MYDPETAALIRQTPELPGLDREDLPDALSRAYAEIASARVMLREEQPSLEQLSETIDFAQRLARTNEALLVASPERENRAAAAFVAATAYQLVRQAEAIREDARDAAYLRADAISPEISAMLLFLAAEASADAAEVSRHISFPEDEPLQANLIWTLLRLARGEVGAITDSRRLARRRIIAGTDYEQAVAGLYYQLLRGVRALAFRLQGRRIRDMADPIVVFEQVKSLASPAATDALGDLNAQALVAFPGPFHLASLLIILGRSLLDGAVVSLPAPDGTDSERWRKAMQGVAATRPYLWRNHKSAVDRGYLTHGVSSVIGFPTGAGKSTVSQLKIHAALLGAFKVVFLAPTNALVDQTATDLNKAFKNARVRGQREDEFNDEELPDILVMTPEACLAAGHAEPHVFADVGLLIFDECHLLHPQTDANKRAIDAMLCILMMARIAPNADFLLLSAMMRNTEELSSCHRVRVMVCPLAPRSTQKALRCFS
ncbi:MAG: DEAD/DEAH box helicase, partial [Pseudomonadota bacterium]